MGKFNLKAAKKEQRKLKKIKDQQIKKVLKSRKLLKVKYSKKDPTKPVDAILLFGSHKGESIKELLKGYETANYVMSYLAQSKNLPKKVTSVVSEIISNQDPFDQVEAGDSLGLTISKFDSDDDIPW